MRELIISAGLEGQRLDRLLARCLKEAPMSFLYKMMRKKNITLNGKKITGSEKVAEGDRVCLWLSDDTLLHFGAVMEAFAVPADEPLQPGGADRCLAKARPILPAKWILYEDLDVLFVNKPSGLLTQKARAEDLSLNEYILAYLQEKEPVPQGAGVLLRPSVCNRLDRNTSGIVAAGKTQRGLRVLNALFQDRSAHKYYWCIVQGTVSKPGTWKSTLVKDSMENKVSVWDPSSALMSVSSFDPALVPPRKKDGRQTGQMIGKQTGLDIGQTAGKDAVTRFRPLLSFTGPTGTPFTLLEVLLVTGRSHQIRVHAAQAGHPILGDPKYGDRRINERLKGQYRLSGQLLHAGKLEIPNECELLSIAGKTIKSGLPTKFQTILSACGESVLRRAQRCTQGGKGGAGHGGE